VLPGASGPMPDDKGELKDPGITIPSAHTTVAEAARHPTGRPVRARLVPASSSTRGPTLWMGAQRYSDGKNINMYVINAVLILMVIRQIAPA
jgi:hypothetical protein